jgi:hypothetical protein
MTSAQVLAGSKRYGAALSFGLGEWLRDGLINSSIDILKRSSAKRFSTKCISTSVNRVLSMFW